MGTKSKIQRLLNQKYKIEKEIGTLQGGCSHKDSHLRFTYPRPHGHLTELRWVCDDCQRVVRIPSEKERNNWLRK